MQLHGQRLETLLLQQGRQILKQPFGAGKFAKTTFGGELPAGGGAHKDRGRWIVDGRKGEGGELLGFHQPPEQGMGVQQE